MPARRRKRIDPALFALPVEQIKAGFYSDAYFNNARSALRAAGRVACVTWQLSVKSDDGQAWRGMLLVSTMGDKRVVVLRMGLIK